MDTGVGEDPGGWSRQLKLISALRAFKISSHSFPVCSQKMEEGEGALFLWLEGMVLVLFCILC